MKNTLLFFLMFVGHISFGQSQKSVRSEYFNLVIELPEGWDLVENEKNLTTAGSIPENLGINFVEKTDETLDQRFEYYLNELEMGRSFRSFREGYEVIGGQKYRWVEYEMKNSGFRFHSYLYLTIHNSALYSINLTSTKARYKSNLNALLEILRTLKMK